MARTHVFSRRRFAVGAAAAPLVGAAALRLPAGAGAQGDPVNVGSKDFPEQFILSNMFGQLLENAGIPVNLDNLNLGGTTIAHQALVSGDIDLYAEYTGTALTSEDVLGLAFPLEAAVGAATPAGSPGASPAASPAAAIASPAASPAAASGAFSALDLQVYDIVVTGYRDRYGLVVLQQTPFNDNQALAVKRSFSEERGVTTISQLAEIAGDLTISAPVDFEGREDGLLGLQRVYGGGFNEIEVLPVQPGIKYDQIESDAAEVVLAFGTDAEIARLDLVVLQDDKGLFPPGHAAPVVRQEVIDAYPNLPDILNSVIPLLTNEVMIGLNGQAAEEEPEAIARQFLVESGLIAG
ncbi:MAG: L-proline glycine betaine binding ABC transporter protein ProX / Osmotic adaptation [uncultured Thermomicrobiales bacterium]|uniref:L-proline glycine betaine binding ABC transporter protein ProX / Osmotic adaptation n=1 Tax=uncultured Thermomicrobiales bacterium TaxID=1645740 RepID=A0A6J4U1P3_9BACT|nr:MAG: L-proline glycine betaine binding ABC transporter protein ProX / Osmotic adaptation [uncultured Thermomicrobiales bacterium]